MGRSVSPAAARHAADPHWFTVAEAKVETLRALREVPGNELDHFAEEDGVECEIGGTFGGLRLFIVLSNFSESRNSTPRAVVRVHIPELSLSVGSLNQPLTFAAFQTLLWHAGEMQFVYVSTYAGNVLIHSSLIASHAGVETVLWMNRARGVRAATARRRQHWVTYELPVPTDTKHHVGCACKRCGRRIRSRATHLEMNTTATLTAGPVGASTLPPEEQWPSFTEAKAAILQIFSEPTGVWDYSFEQKPWPLATFNASMNGVSFWIQLTDAGTGFDADGPAGIEYRIEPHQIHDTLTGNSMSFAAFCTLLRHASEMQFVYIPTYAHKFLRTIRLVATHGDSTLVLFDRHIEPTSPAARATAPAVTYRLPLPLRTVHEVGCRCTRCAQLIRRSYEEHRTT